MLLTDKVNIVAFCDNDKRKWGKNFDGLNIISPEELFELKNIKVIITSSYHQEISYQLLESGIKNFEIFTYDLINKASWNSLKKKFRIKSINLGALLASANSKKLQVSNFTFLTGGSGLLDILFLKVLAVKFNVKIYLEIGTWMGESIAAVSEVVDDCYSISLPDDDFSLEKYFKGILNKKNFSRYFSYRRNNVKHYFADSKKFDYTEIPKGIDLVFIDGDHSYDGVKTDTKNIFEIIDSSKSIVVWHDFKEKRNDYIVTTVNAVYDAVPKNLQKNIFSVDNNMCGVYIPDKFIKEFSFDSPSSEIYSYNTKIEPIRHVLTT
ncbi:class I SAM-dependent methyltransferase [Phosphitispora fastidiosa]|uniref:class I SAM-dependent methyltransferase n=1 Tax=Phosphitispora fastidiosa TaxID=2837202 RepID=UPI001E518AC5|nr:class I SAM-dependent methyltransferase [Phosphitispora fastidiosa]MBU7006393.1 hypothetical protein [Phosphitispora fastidiosa]